ncbi:TetR/AcrR family transcriptional regulator [Streptomyces stramineus]
MRPRCDQAPLWKNRPHGRSSSRGVRPGEPPPAAGGRDGAGGRGGPRAASVQAVADRAGISRGSVAWHFGSKDGLIVEVIEHAFHRACEEYRLRLPETGPLTFDLLIDTHLAVIDAPCGRVFVTVLPEVMRGEGPLRDAYVSGYERTRGCGWAIWSGSWRSTPPCRTRRTWRRSSSAAASG